MKRTVLITGGSAGIGRAACEVFKRAGWEVICVDRAEDPAEGIHFIKGDVSDPDSSRAVLKEAGAMVERLDVLVNNAAIQICKPLLETDVEEWDSVMATNARSVYLFVRNAYPMMQRPGGAIVNVSSVHALATSANIAAYAASKGAVLALTRALAVELAPDGIRVNAVLPGAVDTAMLRAGVGRGHAEGAGLKAGLQSLAGRTPLGRIGRPEEIAQSILFLADNDRSSFITGEALVVDGGALARLGTE